MMMFLLLLLVLQLPSASMAETAASFSLPLIDRYSIDSPFHDPNATRLDMWNSMNLISDRRYDRIIAALDNGDDNDYDDGSMELPVGPGWSQYLTKIKVGTPPVESVVVADTGSRLFRFQCEPCVQCYTQSTPRFDPARSSTYARVPCSSPICMKRKCDESATCNYAAHYSDESCTEGEYGTDVIAVGGGQAKTRVVEGFVFGCGYNNSDRFANGDSGFLGLSYNERSFLRQLGITQFSYCLTSFPDKNKHGVISFGNAATLSGRSTNVFLDKMGHYKLYIKDISVRNIPLNIPSSAFRDAGNLYTITDIGSSVSRLVPEAYEQLVEKMEEVTSLQRKDRGKKLCFLGQDRHLADGVLPDVTIHLLGRVDMKIPPRNLSFQVDNETFCMQIRRGETQNSIGARLQQDINVGFDLTSKYMFLDYPEGGCQGYSNG